MLFSSIHAQYFGLMKSMLIKKNHNLNCNSNMQHKPCHCLSGTGVYYTQLQVGCNKKSECWSLNVRYSLTERSPCQRDWVLSTGDNNRDVITFLLQSFSLYFTPQIVTDLIRGPDVNSEVQPSLVNENNFFLAADGWCLTAHWQCYDVSELLGLIHGYILTLLLSVQKAGKGLPALRHWSAVWITSLTSAGF